MKRTTMMLAAILLSGTTAMATTTEEQCRKEQLEYFDVLTKTCPDNERQGHPGGPVCPDLLIVMKNFVPTRNIPDMATYRMMWSELRTEVCVHLPAIKF
jgi:hypothetical protein